MEVTATCIKDLPVEIFEVIAQFLPSEDLDACFKVCKNWKQIFNSNKIWKKCCFYSEKYFKIDTDFHLQIAPKNSSQELCLWRKYYEHQQKLWKNWSKGQFSICKTGIDISKVSILSNFVDDHGTHWLLDNGNHGITVWNISGAPFIKSKFNQTDHFGVQYIKDKILTFRSNYVKVYQFNHPEYELKLQYRFKFDMDNILPKNEVIPDDDYMSGVRFILVDHFFVGYKENVENIHSASLHIWNLDSAQKIAIKSAFQQSFVDFILLSTSCDITKEFVGGLLLFPGDSGRFLVNLIDDRFKLCQISLFSLDKMKFINVIAQMESRTAWCFMKGEVVVIYHIRKGETSLLSLYNISGQFLSKLCLSGCYNPAFSDEFWFSGSKVILKVKSRIQVVTVIDCTKVCENYFEIDEEEYILSYFDPKFLLLFKKLTTRSRFYNFPSAFVTVWDVQLGLKLWNLGNLVSTRCYCDLIQHIKYPNKLIVIFSGDEELSILNFERGEGENNGKLKEHEF